MAPSSTGSLANAVFTAAAFVFLLVVVVAVARFKQIPLPFTRPRLSVILLWIGLFAVVATMQELIGGYLGGNPAPQWDALTPARMIRAATIILLAPLAEEVAFRGTMYGNLMKKWARPTVAILLPAAVFALIHIQYFGPGLLIIFVDGIVFGVARYHTKSLFVPVLLHALGNTYAVLERIF